MRILPMLLLTAMPTSPAIASVYTFPGLTIYTGAGGQAVTIAATIATVTNQLDGGHTVNPATITLNLPDFTKLSADMDWNSPCEFEAGCVVSAPSQIVVTGFSGTLQFYGGDMLLNDTPLPWDLSPVQSMFVSGPLNFTASAYTDNLNFIALFVPEPTTLALFGVGLLGLGLTVRRRVL